ncbi:hypothetical protein, partial [Pseudomonas prosekii]|uniref:hypothetical protein n=1 Tax=Pseudomonas prosekii TaxID=1148509 RepID=UPI001C7D9869
MYFKPCLKPNSSVVSMAKIDCHGKNLLRIYITAHVRVSTEHASAINRPRPTPTLCETSAMAVFCRRKKTRRAAGFIGGGGG